MSSIKSQVRKMERAVNDLGRSTQVEVVSSIFPGLWKLRYYNVLGSSVKLSNEMTELTPTEVLYGLTSLYNSMKDET